MRHENDNCREWASETPRQPLADFARRLREACATEHGPACRKCADAAAFAEVVGHETTLVRLRDAYAQATDGVGALGQHPQAKLVRSAMRAVPVNIVLLKTMVGEGGGQPTDEAWVCPKLNADTRRPCKALCNALEAMARAKWEQRSNTLRRCESSYLR
jgi:hypothetical protein